MGAPTAHSITVIQELIFESPEHRHCLRTQIAVFKYLGILQDVNEVQSSIQAMGNFWLTITITQWVDGMTDGL